MEEMILHVSGGVAPVLFCVLVGFGLAAVLVHLFGCEGRAGGVFILECTMPVSVAACLWIEMHDPKGAPAVASFILICTLLSVAVLPLALTFRI